METCRVLYWETWRTIILEVYGLKELGSVIRYDFFFSLVWLSFRSRLSNKFNHSLNHKLTNYSYKASPYMLHLHGDEKYHHKWIHPLKKITLIPHLTFSLPGFFSHTLRSTVMFALSTKHVALAVSEHLRGFVYELDSTTDIYLTTKWIDRMIYQRGWKWHHW